MVANRRIYKKNILLILIIGLAPLLLFADDGEKIGVVLAVSGTFEHHYIKDGKRIVESLEPEAIIYRNSVVIPAGGRGAYFQVGTEKDKVKIGSFPDSSFTVNSEVLSDKKHAIYVTAIGGHTLRGKGSAGNSLFENGFVPTVIERKEIDNGFFLVLSPTRNSMESGSLNPFYLQLAEDKEIASIAYTLVLEKRDEIEKGLFTKTGRDWLIPFDELPVSVDNKPYTLCVLITYYDGTTAQWEWSFRIFGEKEKDILRGKAMQDIVGMEQNDSLTAFAIAARFSEYGMQLTAWQILTEQGIDFRKTLKK